MDFSIVSPVFFNTLKENKGKADKIDYTVTVTPFGVEYSFPLVQEDVVRTLIKEKQPLMFQSKGLGKEQSDKYLKQVDKLIKEHPFLKFYNAGRNLLMFCIQDRSYSIEKRFLLMNFAMKNMQVIIDKGDENEASNFVEMFFTHNDKSDIMDIFKNIKPDFSFSVMDALSMLNSLPPTEKFDKVRDAVFKKLDFKEDRSDFGTKPVDEIEKKYIELRRAFSEKILRQGKEDNREYYLENIMVGYIWSMKLPYADFSLNMWDNFAFLNILFNIVKVLLTLYVNEETLDDDVVEAITALDESFRRVNGLARATIASLNQRGFNNNGDMAVLALS